MEEKIITFGMRTSEININKFRLNAKQIICRFAKFSNICRPGNFLLSRLCACVMCMYSMLYSTCTVDCVEHQNVFDKKLH